MNLKINVRAHPLKYLNGGGLFKVLRRWILLFIIVVGLGWIVACERKPSPEDSCNFVQNSDLQRVSWEGKLPVQLYVHSSVPTQYYPAIQRAVDQWNKSMNEGHDLLHIEGWGVTGHDTPAADGYSIIYWLNTWEADKPTEQARTTIYWTGSRIYEADMRINASNFTYYGAESTTDVAGVDLQSLVLHELGHVFGLAHVTTIGSVMVPSLASNVARRVPGPTDIQSLKCEY